MNELLPIKPKLNIKRVIITIAYFSSIILLIVVISIKAKQTKNLKAITVHLKK